MSGLFVAAEVKELIAVTYNAFPLFFKQRLQLCQVLQDDTHRNATGTHNRQNLIEIVGKRHIGELVHQEVDGHWQAPAVDMVGSEKQLLKKLRVKDRHQKIKA